MQDTWFTISMQSSLSDQYIFRAFRVSGHFSRVGYGQRDPTRPDPTRPDPTRESKKTLLTRSVTFRTRPGSTSENLKIFHDTTRWSDFDP